MGKPAYQGIGYTGHVMDAATGLTYMQQRYYDPSIGRFLSVDPVTADGNTGDNFNRYWYANNNPYKFTDPDGRLPVETLWDAANVAMGATSAYNNFSQGNIGAGIVDSLGVLVDVAATAVPYVPGGASAAIGAIRTGDKALDTVKASDRVRGVATGTGRAADRAALRDAGVPTSQSRSDVKGPGGIPVPKAERQQMTRDSRGNPVVVSRHQPHPGGKQSHDSKTHSHAATARVQDGQIDRRRDGSVRYHE
ncbi:MAG TPA: RHS repeat-associated core domain-containing protein [Lysobacter sp.]